MPKLYDRRLDDTGFTLIELMVVLLIMAILLAIAIPTFLGVTNSASDRAAQANLNTGFVNSQSVFQDNGQSFPAVSNLVNLLGTSEPNLSFTSGAVVVPSAGKNLVSINTDTTGDAVILAAKAKSGRCWYIVGLNTGATTGLTFSGAGAVPNTAGTWYGVDTTASDTCSAASPLNANITWQMDAFPAS
jgi:type IV pilus assembly protein PilA